MSEGSITAFQADVARLFFALPEAGSFLLAGGLALVAHGMTDRPTEDLDAFTSKAGDVSKAAEAFVRAAIEKQWTVDMVQESETFVRLSVAGEAALIVDIALAPHRICRRRCRSSVPPSRQRSLLRENCWHSSTGRCRATSSICSASSGTGTGTS